MSKQQSNFFHAHMHTQYSPLDGMGKVERQVAEIASHGQPGFATTDHGNMAATVAAYKAAKAHDLRYAPGLEGYLIDPAFDGELEDSAKAGRYHLGLLALSEKGYKGLVKFTSMTHTRPRFNRFPRFTIFDLAEFGQEYGKHVALTTGCYFGWLQQTIVNEGAYEAERVLKMYSEWFPNTYVEVQHHDINHENDLGDDQMVRELMSLAKHAGLPVIATQDAHYVTKSEKTSHALMKRMVYGGIEDEFPGDSFHTASTKFVRKHYTDKQWSRIEDGLGDLLGKMKCKITPLDKFVVDVPGKWKKPMDRLRTKAEKAHLKHMKKIKPSAKMRKVYEAELAEQLSVIEDLGMAAYFLIWDEFVRFCKRAHIAIEARGSANGSYVCFLLGITQIDSVADGCMAERFLSRDRIKPPDIDMDIEDGRRQEALEWVFRNYDSVQIGTWGQLGITVDPETGEERGSVFTTWIQGKRRQCIEVAWEAEQKRADKCAAGKCKCKGSKCFGTKPVKYRAEEAGKAKFKKDFGWMNGLPDVRKYDEDEWLALQQINSMKSVFRSYGVHAGGVLLSGNKIKIEDYIPTMLVASSNTTVSQYDMDAVEEFGILKMDILGQTSLSVMRRCQVLMGKPDPTDFSWIPRNDPKALPLLRDGRTNTGIFHFEGYTKSKGGRELGVKSVKDAILVQALYMPGCMDIAEGQPMSMKDLYIRRRRNGIKGPDKYLHPVFEKHLAPTLGCVVFQEQVIAIMRDLGMSIASVNKFFKVVKDSGKGATERNRGRMAEVRAEFDKLCKKNKIDPDEAWSATASFVAYGFNRNHATGYGVRSYRTAYLKAHHQLEYVTALLQAWQGRDKEKVYLREARRLEIPIRPPDINNASSEWTMDKKRNAIRKPLVSIAGIGQKAADELALKGPFKDMDDLASKVNGRIITGVIAWRDGDYEKALSTGVLGKLNQAGVLEDLRQARAKKRLG